MQLDHLEHEHAVFREVLKAIVETATTTETLQASDFEGLDSAIASLVPDIAARIDRFLPHGLGRSGAFAAGGEPTLFPVSRGRREEDLAAAVSFFLPRTLNDMIAGLSQVVGDELARLRYLGPLRSYPPRHLAFAQHHDPNWQAGGGYAWDVVRRDRRVRHAVNQWLGSSERLHTPYELQVRELVATEDLENPYWESLERMAEDGLGMASDYNREGNPEAAHPTIKDFEHEVARFKQILASSPIEHIHDLVLIDRRSNTLVSHRDVGIGISQVLPVLVTTHAFRHEIAAIEQPEIHLHPRLQAELGDVFIASALGEQRNRFLLETHSEHLILRIMRRMRETAQKRLDGLPPCDQRM